MARWAGIHELAFQPAQKAALGFEVFKLSELRARFEREALTPPLESPMRLDFHLVYVGLCGRGELVVDFTPAPLGAGFLTVVARGRVHQYLAERQPPDAWMLLFSPELLATGANDPRSTSALLSARAAPSFALDATLRRELLTLCELLAAEYARTQDALQPALLSSMLRAVLLRAERAARGVMDSTPPRLARFFAALERDALTTRSVAHYARAAGLSTRRLGDLLVEHTGRSTKQVIDERVVLEAKRLLAHTHLSIKELAHRVGFSEPTNFVKFFRLHTRETPLGFRARFHHPSARPNLVGEGTRR
jgi:AraC-like DNA-binding protein